jgi:hypothetical protein
MSLSYLANSQNSPLSFRLSPAEKEEFLVGVGMLSTPILAAVRVNRDDLIEVGGRLVGINLMVCETETLADYTRDHGRPADTRTTLTGAIIHVWDNVHFQGGAPKGTLYLMEFADVRGSAYTGGW